MKDEDGALQGGKAARASSISSGMVGGDDSARPGSELRGAERSQTPGIALGTAEVVDELVARDADHPRGGVGIAPKAAAATYRFDEGLLGQLLRQCGVATTAMEQVSVDGRQAPVIPGAERRSSAKTAATSTRPSMIAVDGCTCSRPRIASTP